MHSKIAKQLKSINVMAKSNFESWIHSSRTLIMLLFVVAFCYVVTSNHVQSMLYRGYQLHFFESLFFLLNQGCSITTTSVLFLITCSELPRRIGYQHNLLIRSSRTKWLESQMIYCVWMTVSMLILIVISTSAFISIHVLPGSGWSDVARIASGTIQENEAAIPFFIRSAFEPWQACLVAMVPMFMFWLTMIFVVLLFSLCQMPIVGFMIYALMLVADIVFMVESFGDFPMPIYYATLYNITSGAGGMELAKVQEVFLIYGALIIGLIFLMFICVRKTDLCFLSEE